MTRVRSSLGGRQHDIRYEIRLQGNSLSSEWLNANHEYNDLTLSEITKQASATQRISRMALLAEELRAQLDNFNRSIQTAGQVIPEDVVSGLGRISSKLDELKESVRSSEHERSNLQALAEIGQVVNSSLDLTTVLSEVIDTIIRLTGAERAFLMLHNEDSSLMPQFLRTLGNPSPQGILKTPLIQSQSLHKVCILHNWFLCIPFLSPFEGLNTHAPIHLLK